MVYMLNELSIQKVDSKQTALGILEKFVKASIIAKEVGITELRLYEGSLKNLYQLDICSGYNIDNWLQDNSVDIDLKDKFREILASSPLITDLEIEQNDVFQWSEFYKTLNEDNYRVYGLGAAFIYDTLAISLDTNSDWKDVEVKALHRHLGEDYDELNDEILVKHFCDVNMFTTHLSWWHKIQKASLKQSIEIWERKEEFFPSLIFCKEVERQLQKIGVSKMLSQIIDRLRSLNQFATNWQEGNFSYEDANSETNLRISPESISTLRLFSSLRKFTIPNQGKKVFVLHIKTGDLRFHFYPDNENKKIYIGYIGKHLRIASED